MDKLTSIGVAILLATTSVNYSGFHRGAMIFIASLIFGAVVNEIVTLLRKNDGRK